ncbi:hypothetical protein EIP86_007837 [Pleurotus ostreatoroseus]|nr:hypothetical protein EIP86_007837 [Pleurotus ostreatoroseus]
MDKMSPKVQDDGLKTADGRPITGGHLFRKYLLGRTQECFERNLASEDTNVAEALPTTSGELVATVITPPNTEVAAYWASQEAQRQDLGVIKFMAELFKSQMITERIMHESVKKLLGNVVQPDEKRIEGLCELLTTAGARLDTPKARAHLDVYFSRMKTFASIRPRTQAIVQGVIELRERKWESSGAQVSEPATTNSVNKAIDKKRKKGKKQRN